ncbi:Ig-like domain-containing protein [Brevibacillus centrosporus]|uniref:Ig-like domain-containing protein n=1 Tax=Brevibacillus centrosporus TaxID=54910 RepID=UPI002E2197C8|nr:Ig-like domain-containing protein [Brevibacillus centrosporus]
MYLTKIFNGRWIRTSALTLLLTIFLAVMMCGQIPSAAAAQPSPCMAIGDPSSSNYSSLNIGYFDFLMQTFQAKHTADVTSLDVYLQHDLAGDDVGIDFLSLTSDDPSTGTIIGHASARIQGTGWKTMVFPQSIPIVAGQKYAVKIYQLNSSRLVTMVSVSQKEYSDGLFYVYKDGIKQIDNQEEIRLKLYMKKGDPSRSTSNLAELFVPDIDNVLRVENDGHGKYLVIVLPQATTLTISPKLETPADSYLEVNGQAWASGAPYTISVNEGINPVDFSVKTGDCSEQKVYSVQVVKDTTPPTITWTTASQPNAAGWFNGDVTVKWSVADSASGIDPATVPNDSLLTGEGDNLSVTAAVRDKAGNTATATAAGIKIDRTAPVTVIAQPVRLSDGTAAVSLAASDTLSGVKTTYYQIDSDVPQSGHTVSFQTDGTFLLKAWSEDTAGNVEQAQSVTVHVDMTAPDFAANYPKTGNIGNNRAEVVVKTNETGVVYYAVVPQNATAPLAAQVKAGTDAAGMPLAANMHGNLAVTENQEESFDLTGLRASTSYTIYLVAEDLAGNLAANVTALPFRTKTPVSPPAYYPVEQIRLNEEQITLKESGDGVYLRPLITPVYATNQQVSWSTSDEGVVRVNQNGYVEPVSAGEAIVRVTTIDGNKTASVKVTVEPAKAENQLAKLIVDKPSLMLQPGDTASLKVTAVYEDGTEEEITQNKNVKVKSSSNLVTVKAGQIKAGKKEGEATITVSYEGKVLEIKVLVSKAKVRYLTSSYRQILLGKEEKRQLTLFAVLFNGKKTDVTSLANWQANDSKVIRATEGEVMALTKGKTKLTATYGGRTYSIPVTVVEDKKPQRIAMEKHLLRLAQEDLVKLSVKGIYEDGFEDDLTDVVSWEVENPDIATVSDGELQAHQTGTTTVTAKYAGKTARLKVVVRK